MFKAKIKDTISPVLSQLASVTPVLEAKVEVTAAETYLGDVLGWIDGGKAFENRTGNLRASIVINQLNGNSVVSAGDATTVAYKNPSATLLKEKFTRGQASRNSYAPLVEFGTKNAAPYPYLFADTDHRQQHLSQSASRVIAQLIAQL